MNPCAKNGIEVGISTVFSKRTLMPRSHLVPVQLHVLSKCSFYTLLIKRTCRLFARLSDLDLFEKKDLLLPLRLIITSETLLLAFSQTFFLVCLVCQSYFLHLNSGSAFLKCLPVSNSLLYPAS